MGVAAAVAVWAVAAVWAVWWWRCGRCGGDGGGGGGGVERVEEAVAAHPSLACTTFTAKRGKPSSLVLITWCVASLSRATFCERSALTSNTWCGGGAAVGLGDGPAAPSRGAPGQVTWRSRGGRWEVAGETVAHLMRCGP